MSPQESITLGVFSGVITAALLFLAKEFWVKIITPWYQGFRYKGADISGSWYAERNDNDAGIQASYTAVFQQSAHIVTGSMQVLYSGPDRKFTVDYQLSGEYWEGYLNLSCRSKDRKMYSHASLFLKLINGGGGLLGQYCFRNAFEDVVSHIPMGLDRK